MAPKAQRNRTKQRRNENRKALRKARDLALIRGEPEPGIQPSNAMQYVLDRAVHMLRNAEAGVEKLEPDEVWRDTQVGKIPNEWIRLEADLRQEVAQQAGRMIALDIEGRRANAAEAMALALAPVFKQILAELNLTPDQQAAAPAIVERGLKLLEGGQRLGQRED